MSKLERLIWGVSVGAVAALVMMGLFWLGGFNFDVRGLDAAFCAAMAMASFAVATITTFDLLEPEDDETD